MRGILFPCLNEIKNSHNFPLGGIDSQTPQMCFQQTTLVCLHVVWFGHLWICNIIFIIIDQCRLFTSAIDPDVLWMSLKILLYSLFRQPEFCLRFILSKNKVFQSGTLLKMTNSSPSMQEFCVGVQEQISLTQTKTLLSKNNKNAIKKTGFKGNIKYKEAVCFYGYLL